ncbi:GH32 C-terminal domain-containing protein [Microbulbifer rhizosphaerae]|uniref:beta-fructofuranosidase n=1 Tax=Microbulbifer rhizosphaerae TaxID=1562603 RepID=A0A7W4WEW4_9GAMM|nr:GH32 C-terminal domain-containing protein [Microbulbifer rhizosphaerae]MBB3062301.1 sucrose-6-phosphate hydrolase SacC (GH32 family) [Microbulbifer rhizosphaerae]
MSGLQRLFGFLFLVLVTPLPVAAEELPVYRQDFERLDADTLAPMRLHTQFAAPDSVPGVVGRAWRSDGFSSWAELPQKTAKEFSLTIWLALESYPSDLEVPVSSLSPSSIVHQWDDRGGFDIHIDTFGRWGARLQTDKGEVGLAAEKNFPLYQWVQLGLSVNEGEAVLYLDGKTVARKALPAPLRPAGVPIRLARAVDEAEMLNFTVNRLNGAFDELRLYRRGLSAAEMRAIRGRYPDTISAELSLAVPESRFAGDHLRPRLHAMPPANWSNEPHGFVKVGDLWHLFYQRTPNGPYKTQMHWGHMVSRDLLRWENIEDALWPELQTDKFGFDMKGIWSGDVIYDGGKAFAFYTSVNHFDRLKASNPGVSMAVSEDPELRHWRKLGPIINSKYVRDFRDPYLFRDGGTWHMLIGAALKSGGGLDYHVLEKSEEGGNWEHRRRFVSEPYREMDIGSLIWEMPVFEPISDDTHILVVNPIGGEVSKYGDPATRAVYWMGRWRDGLFHPYSSEPKNLDLLPGHLAPTVERASDDSLRAIGIVDERRTPQAQEDAGWAHTFSFPRRWQLLEDGRTLGQSPAPELTALRGRPLLETGAQILSREPRELLRPEGPYELLIEAGDDQPLVLEVDLLVSPDEEYTRLGFDGERNTLVLDKTHSSKSSQGEGPNRLQADYDSAAFGPMRTLRIFVDASVIEVFINDAAAFSFRSYPQDPQARGVRLSSPGGEGRREKVTVWPLHVPGNQQPN